MNQRTAKADLISPAPARDSRRRLPRFTARRVKMLFVGVLMTGSVLPIGSQVAEAYDAWNCGTVTHSYPVAAGSASLSSTVYGCGTKVAIRCNPPQTGILLGNLAWTGQTSSRNCPAGVVNYRGHQLGTGW